jgi:hypothetical protein
MIRGIIPVGLLCLFQAIPIAAYGGSNFNPDAMPICSQIIIEMTEGRISAKDARHISLSIARAGNRHFGRITAGDMWLYMALVYVESGFRTNVVNYQNCRGMFQIHAPSWAGKFGLRYVDLLDPETNADCGVRIFKYYLELYKNVIPALSAYNSDHPGASLRYARAVLGTRKKIMKRYIQLYQTITKAKVIAASTIPF